MDTLEQAAIESAKQEKRRRRSVEEKRRIVEETLEAGASVARVARRHAVNANQVFYWRKKYREGRLGSRAATKLLPVTITHDRRAEPEKVAESASISPLGAIEIVLPKGKVYITGRVDTQVLRTAMDCLLR